MCLAIDMKETPPKLYSLLKEVSKMRQPAWWHAPGVLAVELKKENHCQFKAVSAYMVCSRPGLSAF